MDDASQQARTASQKLRPHGQKELRLQEETAGGYDGQSSKGFVTPLLAIGHP